MKLSSTLGAALGAAALVVTSAGVSSAAPTAYTCPIGNICFYSGSNGTGQRCNWQVSDPDWRAGTTTCSWSSSANVRSVYNNGYTGVVYYTGANYTSRVGCTGAGGSGNLTGTYKVRSHEFGGC
ncbi:MULTISPECIES: peptidase inhibitor family I36 protein [unclassified Streptomyces]|uniref:peptidase inhibitor family I36 protein n=1 Tax=unclassified Streptomyces TaxID=2593676 RepID=UPI0036381E38